MTRMQIEEIFNTENSFSFGMYKFLSENLDYAFRFLYIDIYLIYLGVELAVLYDLLWLYIVSIILFILSVLGFLCWIVRNRMIEEEWKLKKALKHYTSLEFIIPKERR